MRCMLPWELRCVLGGNRSESEIIILYSASEQGYLVLALYKHALLLLLYAEFEYDTDHYNVSLIDNHKYTSGLVNSLKWFVIITYYC